MEEIWNEAELRRPPLITIEISNAKFAESLHQKITSYLHNHKQDEKQFSETAALLSRLIARRNNSFRRMIGFRYIRKLNSATCRLLRVDLPRDLERFCSALPDMVYGATGALPTRDCLDFVLMRLLCVYHIHQRIFCCAIEAATHLSELIRANFFFDINTLFLAVVAKLQSLNVLFGNRSAELYHCLLKHRAQFPLKNQKCLLPDSMELPNKLTGFHVANLNTEENVNMSHMDTEAKLTMVLKTDISKAKQPVDTGTEVKRVKKMIEIEKKFDIGQLKTIEDVKRFIATENKALKKSPETSIVKKIPNHLWVGAQKIFERKLLAGEHKKALNIFRKFLSTNL